MAFSPVSASEQIVEKYKRYLTTIFQISDPGYAYAFQRELNDLGSFVAGPYLDVTDSFVKGETLARLMQQGTIAGGFRRIAMLPDRPLYKHQQIAIEKAIQGQNLVVSTGTGSGKTECFLIPILNELVRQHEAGQLDRGVRALLIYPMNALANDQIERLRGLLADCPEITFGSYTGQTKERYKDALQEYRQLNNGQEPAKNELISREQMKSFPPHILITNYAMLEYLMLRPADSVFFERRHAAKWRYIVLDEAHVYNGSTGIEVSMLLRRLKARLENTRIQYFLTSATLGSEDANAEVAAFAERLCASPFSPESVVRAFRERAGTARELVRLPFAFYAEAARLIEQDEPLERIQQCIATYSPPAMQPAASAMDALHPHALQPAASAMDALHDMVLHDDNYHAIRSLLTAPRTLAALSREMGVSQQEIADFVTVASRCEKDGARLFDARYHMFLRATESVFVTLSPCKKLFLTRKKEHIEPDGTAFKLFEIATCTHCHSVYLIGQEKNGCLEQWNGGSDDAYPRALYLLADTFSDTDDDHTLADEQLETEEYAICARCGFLRRQGGTQTCGHDSRYFARLFKVRVLNESGDLTKCLTCENTSAFGVLRRFFTGQEAVTSVIGTALFEALPAYRTVTERQDADDDTGFGFSGGFEVRTKQKEAKQFIAFSDNRQAAAFYASYLSQSYRNILYRRLVVETLMDTSAGPEPRSIDRFVEDLLATFERHSIATRKGDVSRKEAWKAILADIVDNASMTSLCSLGLAELSIDPAGIPANPKLKLSAEEVQSICSVFALSLMSDAAVDYPVSLNKSDKEFFTHNGVEYAYTLSDSNPKGRKRSFIPTKAQFYNKRLDYLMRVLALSGQPVDRETATRFLEAIWKFIFCGTGLVKYSDGGYRLDTGKMLIARPRRWHVCSKCRKITPFNVKGACPTYKCDGTLSPAEPGDMFQKNHYYQMYQSLDMRDLRVVEHTAQLNRETAYEYQKKFKLKEIDILSCSTTFEMGVDVGTLETVFMRNMPPSPANYAQRAGRAGRSRHSAAYAVTFCTKSNHDFSFFRTPEKMIRGRIDPPRFIIQNEKIAIRHVYASAFSFFWKQYPSFFDDTEQIIDKREGGLNGIDLFCQYIESHPDDLRDFLKRFLPPELSHRFGIEHFGWASSLLSENPDQPGVLRKGVAEYLDEIGKLDQAIDLAGRHGNTYILIERIRAYKSERVLEFLSRKNVLPKYGFPVDTVEMSIVDLNGKAKLGLQLERDLSMAISEYAPGSQIVANGNLITSRYIRKVPRMSWKMYDYIRCPNCNTLNIEQNTGHDELSEMVACKLCGTDFEGHARDTFLIPEFGFEADGDRIEKPGLRKPERTFRSEIAYIGYRDQLDFEEHRISRATIRLVTGSDNEMAVTNNSKFFVCTRCGYAELDDKAFTRTKRSKHKSPSGYWCNNDGSNILRRYALGYKFKTDVTQVFFMRPDITDHDAAYSILQGVLRGACSQLNIEQSDISGCVQYFFNSETQRPNYSLVLYDTTPGGAGHVKRISTTEVLASVLREALALMEQCDCGGEQMDSSCYACLRSYRNQKYHDILKRGQVVAFLGQVLG